ncbi:aspartate/glutamate racemase family protein [Halarcobacter bivalviorum]|uniref:Aspartate racemase n=1 Tax=Halarcobacter bivalviorum TaxID=663364 RepID=A0AAX2ABA4_9BACT|nr:aspartate/glutamate racemase family protein [Halarcobacter bivalviorum]AXH12081.1 aspartate/glutamate racemase family protein [Halarcobacter bivalviorum]RXK11190.1 aspartate racemase [Halarcobacter bivalviorum]
MKTIGLLGGMSWESTALYYKQINEEVKKQLGGLHSAKVVIYSVDFDEIEKLQHEGKWDETAKILSEAAKNIQNASADFLVICTNTMHKVAPTIQEHIDIPILHIANATGKKLQEESIKRVGLLGTAFTMQQDFYKDTIQTNFDIEVIVPSEEDIKIVHKIIYEELCLGTIKESSKKEYLRIIDSLSSYGAQGVILGCTEIGMLVSQEDTNIKLFDTTYIHAIEAVNKALN